jgi:hypothetical protein
MNSLNCHVYLREAILYLPTMGKMDEGFYRGVEPVTVAPMSNAAEVREALQTMISRGNPIVPILRRRDIPPPVLLKYAGVKRWSEFERGIKFWTIEQRNGVFKILREAKQPDGFWKPDPKQTITFPAGTAPDDVIERMIAILQSGAGSSK